MTALTPRTPAPAAQNTPVAGAILIGAYLLLAPTWAPPMAPEIFDRVRVLQLGLLWLLSGLLLLPGVRQSVVGAWLALGTGPKIALGAVLGGGAISAAVSAAPQIGALQVGLMALLTGLTLMTMAAVKQSRDRVERLLVFSITAGAALFILNFAVTYVLYYLEGRPFVWNNPFFNFANVRFFAQYQSYVLLLLTLPCLMFRLRWRWRLPVYLVAAMFWSFQWVLNSRSVWLGFAIALLAVCLVARSGRLKWTREQLALVLVGGLISLWFQTPGSLSQVPAALSYTERSGQGDRDRLVLLRSAAAKLTEAPLTGVGPGQFGLHYTATRSAHPHNSPLQWLGEYGLVAGGAAVALPVMLLWFGLRRLRERTREGPDAIALALVAALTMGLVDSLFSGNLTMPHSQIMFSVLAGWILGRDLQAYGRSGVSVPGPVAVAVVGVLALACLVTLILTFEYLDIVRELRMDRVPNFWQYGRFDAW